MTYDATGATRDALGRVVKKTETLQGTTHVFGYTYDVQGRLTDVSRDGTAIEHYGYDLNGNRTTATVNGTTVNPTYDDQDRLLTYGSSTFTYTANGELRTKTDSTGTTTYTYDAMGSLIAVSLPDGRLIEYVTDGKGRRVGKMVNGVLTKQWLYRDQLKPVAELDGAGNLVGEFVYGTKANAPDLVIRNGVNYRILSDQLGSPVFVVNTANSGDIPFQASYAAFGDRTLVAGTDDWMPFGFAGGIYDPDTKLTRFGVRDYDARLGRWLSKDPLLFGGHQVNLYVYVGNDPVNRIDPSGREGLWDLCKNTLSDVIEAAMDVYNWITCSSNMGHYQDLYRQCEKDISDACSGSNNGSNDGSDDWLNNDQCMKYNGGVTKDDINRCVQAKDPGAYNKMLGCMSI